MRVSVTWTTTPQTTERTHLTGYRVRLVGPDARTAFVPFGTLTASFDDVAPGDYVAHVESSSADGSEVDHERTAAFTVPFPTVDGPDVVTVALG